ncbi:MAG: regulatory protein RecX [Candidatus Nanopelagicales bacterium]
MSTQDGDPEALARTIVLRRLTGSARTRAELEKALAAKSVPAEVAEAVLDRFTELGLIDDAEYAAAFTESRRHRGGWSRRAMQAKLRERGVPRDLVTEAMATVDADDERASALALARRRWNTSVPLEVRRRRLTAMLARRGYSHDIVHSVLRAVEAESPDGPEVDDEFLDDTAFPDVDLRE